MATKQYLKVSLFLKKLPSITDEQFHNHWKGTHKDVALQIPLFKQVVRKYNQVRLQTDHLKDNWSRDWRNC